MMANLKPALGDRCRHYCFAIFFFSLHNYMYRLNVLDAILGQTG